jgi:hypothetical protein
LEFHTIIEIFASDEMNCPIGVIGDRNLSLECQPNSFRCNDGQCILTAWKCDGDADCSFGKSIYSKPLVNQFQKSDFLSVVLGEDEKNCEKRPCGSEQFQCDDGVCIAESLKYGRTIRLNI